MQFSLVNSEDGFAAELLKPTCNLGNNCFRKAGLASYQQTITVIQIGFAVFISTTRKVVYAECLSSVVDGILWISFELLYKLGDIAKGYMAIRYKSIVVKTVQRWRRAADCAGYCLGLINRPYGVNDSFDLEIIVLTGCFFYYYYFYNFFMAKNSI